MELIKILDMRSSESGTRKRWALFRCSYCGKIVEKVRADGLKNKSCGCARHQLKSETSTIHGQEPRALYLRWTSMKSRCYNPNDPTYSYYGAIGIGVCKRWQDDFTIFRKWAFKNGYKEDLHFTRKDRKKDYSPTNCCFMEMIENRRRAKCTKLDEEKVREIRQLYNEGYLSQDALSKKYGTTEPNISRIVNNKGWYDPNYKPTRTKAKLDVEKVHDIRLKYAKGNVSQRALARDYGVNQSVIGRIIRNELWKDV